MALRIGILGAGGIAAKRHLPELVKERDRGRCEIASVAGRKEHRLAALREHFGVDRSTTDYEALLADDGVDAVVVATPHPLHVDWGIRCLEAGKHVLMQKPLCAKREEADRFVEAAERSDRVVMCLPHLGPSAYRARRMVADGAVGRVSGAYARTSHGGPEVYYREVSAFFGEPEPSDLWFFDPRQADAGALFDMGVYAVANLVGVLGRVVRVSGMTATIEKPTTLEDQANLVLAFESGALATAETSWADPARTWALSVHGSDGKLTAPGADGASMTRHVPTALDSDRSEITREAVEVGDGLGSASAHWLDCIERGETPPFSNARTARHVTEVLLAGLEAGPTGRSIDIESSL